VGLMKTFRNCETYFSEVWDFRHISIIRNYKTYFFLLNLELWDLSFGTIGAFLGEGREGWRIVIPMPEALNSVESRRQKRETED
jgi:hypothetical protein